MLTTRLNEILTAKMLKAELTTSDLSRKIGVATSTIQKIRSGVNENPTMDNLLKIANYFNITVSELIGEVEYSAYHKVPIVEWENLQTISMIEHQNYIYIKGISDSCFGVYVEQNLGKIDGMGVVIVDQNKPYNNNDIVVVLKDRVNIPAIRKIVIEGFDSFLESLNPASTALEPLSESYLILGVVCMYQVNFK